MFWDSEEDIFRWVECRVSRYYWLGYMSDAIESSVRSGLGGLEVHDFFVDQFAVLQDLKKMLVEGSSCIPDCKALCCYFSRDHSTQIPISTDEFEVLRDIVSGWGGNFEDYYSMVPADRISVELLDYLKSSRNFFFDVNGVRMVCLLSSSDRLIDASLLWDLPKSVKRFRRLWADKDSCACRFLDQNNRCVLYDRLRFTVCSEFYCLPVIVVMVLRHLGFVDEGFLGLSLREINLVSNSIAESFRVNKLLGLEREFDSKFRELAIAYVNGGDVGKRFSELKDFERQYADLLRVRVGLKLSCL
ncbi:MAG: hypothetical protein FJY77_02290 [Candidatus Altiarchaeales archaeon]|nr:hypothetical protein [Candidatus Altiarchaeales archaeon]